MELMLFLHAAVSALYVGLVVSSVAVARRGRHLLGLKLCRVYLLAWVAWAVGWAPWHVMTHQWVAVIGNTIACIFNVWLLWKVNGRIREIRWLPEWVHLPSAEDAATRCS